MKILFLTKELSYPVNSGARMRTWHYVRGLVKAGHVHMICYGTPDGQEEGLKVFREMGIDVVFEGSVPPWRARPLLLARFLSLFHRYPYSVLSRASTMLKENIRTIAIESACDVIICDGIHMALNIPSDLPCRKILDEHNVESTIIGRFLKLLRNPIAFLYASWEWLKFRRFEESIWPKFDELHVCSEVDKQQVLKRSRQKNVKVVPNGVSLADAKTQDTRHKTQEGFPVSCDMCHVTPSEKNTFRLVYSGLMGWRPNDDAAIYFIKEVLPLIKKDKGLKIKEDEKSTAKNSEASNLNDFTSSFNLQPLSLRFTVVGKDPTQKLRKLAEQDPAITVTGFVDEVKPYIEGSDVFVVPLRIGSGTRLKILEAMAMGKAVVSTSIGCEGLDVTHGQDIFIADDPKDFAGCVVKLLNDVELRAHIEQAGRELVEKVYDWKLIEENLAALITENG